MNDNSYVIPLNAKKLVGWLSTVATVLLCEHGVVFSYHYLVAKVPWYVRDFFDVDQEQSLPTWFSEFNLLVATTFLWLVWRAKRHDRDPMVMQWMILFLGFALMSIDEVAGIHEMINNNTQSSWAYGGAAICVILLLYFLPFLKSLTRQDRLGFLLAGALFVGGAIGMEFVGLPMETKSLVYALATMVEEGMEMFGIILFTRTLLRHMEISSITWSRRPDYSSEEPG